jgi:hypothetical protein
VFAKCSRELGGVIGDFRRRMNGPRGDDTLRHVDRNQGVPLLLILVMGFPFAKRRTHIVLLQKRIFVTIIIDLTHVHALFGDITFAERASQCARRPRKHR